MLVIYDLDKTSLYCPLANFMDKFIPKNRFLKILYYNLYPIINKLEIKLGLFKINERMYIRAKQYQNYGNVEQVVVTARHYTLQTMEHVTAVFRDIEIPVICVAQGLTSLFKADVVKELPLLDDEEVIMYDDNITELSVMKAEFGERFTGIRVLFNGKDEEISYVN